MAAWIDVYCRKEDVQLDPDDLFRAVDEADLETLVEALDLPGGGEAAVEAARPYLGAEWAGEAVNVYWRAGRPLRVEVLHGFDAEEDAMELLEDLPATDEAGLRRVRAHLGETRSVVYIQLGVADPNQLAATIGEVLAFHLAEAGDGLVRFDEREWASPADRGVTIWSSS